MNNKYELNYDKKTGLVPVVVQDIVTGKVVTVAFTNEAAIDNTLKTKKATFVHLDSGEMWVKGEVSGNFCEIQEMLVDGDGNALIYKVKIAGQGAASKEGYISSFYRSWINNKWRYNGEEKKFDPNEIYNRPDSTRF
jgi:phosphoribosyl-AMP cyclohydrolase